MHIHYFSLCKLADWVNQQKDSVEILEIFSQEKDELVLGFAGPKNEFYLRIGCGPSLQYVWPQKNFHKAKRNSADLFPELIGQRLLNCEVVPADRILILKFSEAFTLILKMHGNRANVILMKNEKCIGIFRNQLKEDLNFELSKEGEWIFPELDLKAESLPELAEQLKAVSGIFSKKIASWVWEMKIQGAEIDSNKLKEALSSDEVYISKSNDQLSFSVLKPFNAHHSFSNIAGGLDVFCRAKFFLQNFKTKYAEAKRLLGTPLRKVKGRLASNEKSIIQIENERSAEELGNILMANLHQMKSRIKKIELQDFYLEGMVSIKLDEKLNPQQNAERYFQKQKKRKAQVLHLKKLNVILNKDLQQARGLETDFNEISSPETLPFSEKGFPFTEMEKLKSFLKKYEDRVQGGKLLEKAKKHNFLEFKNSGFIILVGRNSKNNDQLSFAYSDKNDLWLHAKDVAGSHVIIRSKGKVVPKPTLEFAASLAAAFSKRKSETLVPVIYTPRKYIRSLKGGAPGQVLVSKEEVILIEPYQKGSEKAGN